MRAPDTDHPPEHRDGALAATSDDLPRLVELYNEAIRSLAGTVRGRLLIAAPQASWRQEAPAAELLASPSVCVESGWYEGALVGIGIARAGAPGAPDERRSPTIGVVTTLYVEPLARGVGVGESVLTALVDWCRARDCSGVDVTALPGDRDTKSLLERCGFTARTIVMHRSFES